MSNQKYDKLIEAYIEKFDDSFPTFLAPHRIEEQMNIIEECLRTGVPYDPYSEPDFDPDADY